MSANDQMVFRTKAMGYKQAFDKDRDRSRYVSNLTVSALNLWLAENNEILKTMGKSGLVLPSILSVSSPLFMAAIDTVAHAIHCPVDKKMSAIEFLSHLTKHVGNRYDSEYAVPLRNALKSVQDGFRSVGLLSGATCQYCKKSLLETNLITHKCCGKKFCNDCSNKMRTYLWGNQYQLHCEGCGTKRIVEAL